MDSTLGEKAMNKKLMGKVDLDIKYPFLTAIASDADKLSIRWSFDEAQAEPINRLGIDRFREEFKALCQEVKRLRELVGAQKELITLTSGGWIFCLDHFQLLKELRTKIAELEKEIG